MAWKHLCSLLLFAKTAQRNKPCLLEVIVWNAECVKVEVKFLFILRPNEWPFLATVCFTGCIGRLGMEQWQTRGWNCSPKCTILRWFWIIFLTLFWHIPLRQHKEHRATVGAFIAPVQLFRWKKSYFSIASILLSSWKTTKHLCRDQSTCCLRGKDCRKVNKDKWQKGQEKHFSPNFFFFLASAPVSLLPLH